ncbi:hypothetical protein ACFO0N_11420 [Halobium salinum]|uniref:Uncharacterized protein n=1 Tax=Halobium salinum TaxID=1364940 RepID=A0ABD5PCE8_9EURY|nr:hypothetical protein [Halobium salinum]
MRSPVRHTLLVALLGTLLVGSVTPSVAAPPPAPVCGACGEPFESAADHRGVDLTVERSVATVAVHEDGSATWTVENRVGVDAADRLRANATLLDSVATDAVRNEQSVDASVAADRPVVTLTWTHEEFARRTLGGALLTTEFHPGWAYANYDGLGADRLTVVAPESMHVDTTLDGGTIEDGEAAEDAGAAEDGEATEDGDSDREPDQRTVLTEYDDESAGFVVFAPDAALPSPVPTAIAVAHVAGPLVLRNALVFVGVPVAVFGAVTAAVALGLRRVGLSTGTDSSPVDRGGHLVAAAGGLLVVYSVATGSVPVVVGVDPPALGAGVGLVAFGGVLSSAAGRSRASYWSLLAGALVATGLGASVAAAAAYAGGSLTRWSLGSFPWLLPAFTLVPTGYALARGRIRLALATAAAGFAVPMVATAPLTTPVRGFSLLYVGVGVVAAVGFGLLGVPLLVAGASLAGGRPGASEPVSGAD